MMRAAVVASSFLWVPATCAVPISPPPAPLGAVTVADGTPGDQGYVGFAATFQPALQLGFRHQANRWFAADVQAAGGIDYPFSLSPGLWFTAAQHRTGPRHSVAFRMGSVLGVGALFGSFRYEPFFSVGLDTRILYAYRWSPRGMFHLTFQWGMGSFVPSNLGGAGRTLVGTVGTDIPAGKVAVVLSFSLGVSGDYPVAMGQLGFRFGKPSDTSTVRERKAARTQALDAVWVPPRHEGLGPTVRGTAPNDDASREVR